MALLQNQITTQLYDTKFIIIIFSRAKHFSSPTGMPRALIHGFGTLRKHGKQKKNTNLRKHFFSWGGGGTSGRRRGRK